MLLCPPRNPEAFATFSDYLSWAPHQCRTLNLTSVVPKRKVRSALAFPRSCAVTPFPPCTRHTTYRRAPQDGFLTLVIPMLRYSGGLPVWVHTRRASLENDHKERWDLRVKVELPHNGGDLTGDGSAERERVPGGTGARRVGFGRDGGSALSGGSEGPLSRMQDNRGAKAPGKWKSQASPR